MPRLADLINAAWYGIEGVWGVKGSWEKAGWSLASAVPGVGDMAAMAKWGRRSLETVQAAKRVHQAMRAFELGTNAAQGIEGIYKGYQSGNYVQMALGAFGIGMNGLAARGLGGAAGRPWYCRPASAGLSALTHGAGGAAVGGGIGFAYGYWSTGTLEGALSGAWRGALIGGGVGAAVGAARGLLNPSVCFVAGTQVVVGINPDGSYLTRSIEDLEPGDAVLARDQYNAGDDAELRPVARVFRKSSDHLRIVTIRDGDGNVETIRTTDEHPFWVRGIGWVAAKDLRPGDRLNEADDSNDAAVAGSVREEHPEGISVYNIEVAGDHTYFVEDGYGRQTAVWVHNTCFDYRAAYTATYKRLANTANTIGSYLLEVHHRIPQQFRHLFGDKVIDGLSNLIGLHKNVHGRISGLWEAFSRSFPNATAAQVRAFVRKLDDAGHVYHTLQDVPEELFR